MPAQTAAYLVRYLDARPGWSPDLTLRAARPGDRYLICSDGLSGVVGPDAIRDALTDGGDLAGGRGADPGWRTRPAPPTTSR